jgi:hypothetical protein
LSTDKTVTVTLEGGVIQHVDLPPGVRLVVMDFDTDGVDPADLTYNEEGSVRPLIVGTVRVIDHAGRPVEIRSRETDSTGASSDANVKSATAFRPIAPHRQAAL